MKRRVWPIDGDDRFQIPALLKEWGYPRELWDGELAVSWWYGYGSDCLFWYNSLDGIDPPGSAMLHVAIKPSARKHSITRRALYAVELIPEVKGIKQLITDPPTQRMRDVLIRRGWKKRADGALTCDLTEMAEVLPKTEE